MTNVHQLIVEHGVEGARTRARDAHERRLVDLAFEVMGDDEGSFGINYAGFCVTSFPHRDLGDRNRRWFRKNGRFSLLVEPGAIIVNGEPVEYGVPFGARARLIMLHLQSRAIQTNSREVELGASMFDWMRRMGVTNGGKTYQQVQEQAFRISACRLTIGWQGDTGAQGFRQENITSGMFLIPSRDPGQPRLWNDTVTLTESFFEALKKHPVPVNERAIRALSNQSAALDTYVWLCYRLWKLQKSARIHWAPLKEQFGPEYGRMSNFKMRFIESLQDAMAVYPDAKIDIDDAGIVLHPSRPAVADRRLFALKSV